MLKHGQLVGMVTLTKNQRFLTPLSQVCIFKGDMCGDPNVMRGRFVRRFDYYQSRPVLQQFFFIYFFDVSVALGYRYYLANMDQEIEW